MKKNIALVTGGFSGEAVISYKSATTIDNNLDREKFNVYKIDINSKGWFYESPDGGKAEIDKNDFSLPLDGQRIRFDAVFIGMHGTPGEDGKLQGYFDTLKIPYTSCDAATSALTFNKRFTVAVAAFSGISVANSVILIKNAFQSPDEVAGKLKFPVFVKPNNGGSSIGMKNTGSLLIVLALCIGLNAQKTVNDPNAQVRSVSGYHGVAVSGSIELFLTQGNGESVVVSADDTKLRDKVITEVDDGILRIYLERSKNKIQIDWPNQKKIRAYVSVKDIDYLSSSGSGKLHIDGKIKADKLKIDISGSGNLEGAFATKEFSLGLSGSADADLSGNSEKSEFHISGSGNIKSYEFSTEYCNASISGSGNIKVTVTKELSAHISGSGSVFIKGDGLIRDYSASGSGKFKRVN